MLRQIFVEYAIRCPSIASRKSDLKVSHSNTTFQCVMAQSQAGEGRAANNEAVSEAVERTEYAQSLPGFFV